MGVILPVGEGNNNFLMQKCKYEAEIICCMCGTDNCSLNKSGLSIDFKEVVHQAKNSRTSLPVSFYITHKLLIQQFPSEVT